MRRALFLLVPLLAAPAVVAQNSYLVDSNLDQLFSVDLNTGAATFIASTLNNTLSTPADLAWDDATSTLWTIDLSGGEVGTIDVINGTFTPTFFTGQSGWQAMAWDPTTQKFYLNNQTNPDLYVLDPVTGVTTLVGDTGQGLITAMTVDPSGQLWGTEFSSGALVQIDKNTAAATTIGTAISGLQGLDFAPTGQLFAANTNDDSLYSIDPVTGAATLVGGHGAGVQFAKGFAIAGGGSNYATAATYGAGCGGGSPSTFYEIYTGTNPFDLSNTGFTMFATGNGYTVAPVSSPIVTPSGPPLGLGDDVTVQVPLPFAFPYPGGTTNNIWLCSNGWISFEATTSTDLSESAAELVGGPTRVCPMWDDLNPSAGGTVNAEVDPANPTLFHITFLGVPEYSSTGSNDFQITLDVAGNIAFQYGSCTVGDCLVGFSRGNGVRDPGGIDISTAVQGVFQLGDDSPDLSLVSVARPIIGQVATVRTRDIPANSPAGFVLIGFSALNPGIDLTPINMPGCHLYLNSVLVQGLSVSGATADFSLPIPNSPNLAGLHAFLQTGVIASGANPLGVAASTGRDWTRDSTGSDPTAPSAPAIGGSRPCLAPPGAAASDFGGAGSGADRGNREAAGSCHPLDLVGSPDRRCVSMPSSSTRGLLVALVACVQLVLAPALRPRSCDSALLGGHACCAQLAVPQAEAGCSCGNPLDDSAPTCPADPSLPGDEPDGRQPCGCSHAPDPWLPADDQPVPTSDPVVRSIALECVERSEIVREGAGQLEWNAVPLGRSGPALHVLLCVFLV